jgi:hypothetical protein
MTDTADKLLRCPFCGGEASDAGYVFYRKPCEDIAWEDGSPITEAFFCNCPACGISNMASNIGYRTKAQAIAAWNRRDLAALPGQGVRWQSFDTAPRDGSRILAKGGGLDGVDICSYNARVGCWNCGGVTLDDTDHEPEGYNRPTFWMSLAALEPAEAGGVEANNLPTPAPPVDVTFFRDGTIWVEPVSDAEAASPGVEPPQPGEASASGTPAPAPVDALVKAADGLLVVRAALDSWRRVARDGRRIDPSVVGLGEMIDVVDAALAALAALRGGAK